MTRPCGGSAARLAGLALCAFFVSCEQAPRRRLDAIDPGVYGLCEAAAGQAAWQEARLFLERGDDPRALPLLRACIDACPDFVRAHLAYQDCARRLGGADEAAMVGYYMALPERPSPVAAYTKARLADTSYAQCNALDAILKRDSSFAWAHLSRGRVTRLQGRLLPALDMFAAAIVNDPNLHEAKLERAQVLNELGRFPEAAKDYRDYLAARPDDLPAVREFVHLLLYRLGRVDEAQAWLERLESAEPRAVAVRMDRAAAFWRAGRLQEAAELYLAVLAEVEGTPRAAFNLGLLYYEVAPTDEVSRRRFWPAARAAFQWFLRGPVPVDGHEQFERTLGVPYRLARIAELLGPAVDRPVTLADLAWPGSG